jgi:transcriptional regulator with XRE-family HTH domain
MEYPEFTKAIKRAMKAKDISLRALSRETGIDLSFLSRILSGDRNPPPNSYIIKIAKVLDLNPDQLIIDAGRIPKRAIVLLKGIASLMKPIASALEGKEEELLFSALDCFFTTEQGKKWFLDDYKKHHKQKSLSRSKRLEKDSFARRAIEYFFNTPEGMRWFEDEFGHLEKQNPALRSLHESFNKWSTGR